MRLHATLRTPKRRMFVDDIGAHTLRLKQLQKSFGPNKVLKGIDLVIGPGEFVGLMGPNGAGKSTLIKILAGVYEASDGAIMLGESVVRSLADSVDVGFIHQDLGLVDRLTIVENLSLGVRPKRRFGPILDKAAERHEASAALARVGLDLPLDMLIGDLTAGEKTLVAVARVFGRGAKILVIDETTSTLPPAEASRVIGSLAAAAEGGATVIMVTHKLAEILDASTRVLVLIDGELVHDTPTAGLDRTRLVQMLTEHESSMVPAPGDDTVGPVARECVLELKDVHVGRLGPLNLRVNAGEVIGLSGLPGSGLHDLAFAVNGTLKPHKGHVLLHRADLRRALVPPHRESQGGFADLSVGQNLSLSALSRWRTWSRIIRNGSEQAACERVAHDLSVRPGGIDTRFDVLSGGNKQKVIFGRALLRQPDVYVLCEPTRGVDVQTRAEIYRLVRKLARDGAAVLIASSDAEDLFAVCDRVGLITGGALQPLRAVADLTASELELMV